MAEKIIGWGRCAVTANTKTYKDIVEGSTSLSVEEGDLQEANIEGGEAEATRRKPDKYTLTFERRLGSAEEIAASDLQHKNDIGTVQVEPELAGAVSVSLAHCSQHITLSFDSTDGLKAIYTYQTKGKTSEGALTDVTFGTSAGVTEQSGG
jgi:hypothetical protein